MKQILLSIAAVICFVVSNAQTAYTAPGVFICDQSAAALSTQTPFVLGNQNPGQFTVTYHLSQANAVSGIAAIPGALSYSGTQIVTIYARVSQNSNGAFAISEFKVVWNLPTLDYTFPNQIECMVTQLPLVDVGAFYTEPGGLGTQYAPGTMLEFWQVNGFQTFYWYAGNAQCSVESSFFVVLDLPPTLMLQTLLNCAGNETFDLTLAYTPAMFFHTQADAQNMTNPIENPTAYQGVEGEVVWANMQSFACTNIEPLTLSFIACTPNSIFGTVHISQDGTTCNDTNPGLQNCPVKKTFGSEEKFAYTNASGNYMFANVPVGINTVAPLPTQSYMTVLNPTSIGLNIFSNNQATADFCVQENAFNDVATYLWSLGTFRPAITTPVRLRVFNNGNTAASGTATLTYDASKLTFVSATTSPTSNTSGTLTFNYSLAAHQSLYVEASFTVPTTTVAGDVLVFSANATLSGDQNTLNNATSISQVVVNSYDPNDITCLEGATISPTQAQGYLHYVVRFQNTGTAEALNIRIENALPSYLDASTFRPIAASHTYFTERSGSNLTFTFPNIDLPSQQASEPASHGYVVYEVKPISSIAVGNVIQNQASIFFDTNPPIVTNFANTTVTQLGIAEPRLDIFTLYPNPAKGSFVIRAADVSRIDLEITDVRGVRVLSKRLSLVSDEASVDISGLTSGLYFVGIASERGSVVKKLLVE
ncbi:T9SS type A sorting domain-containing protein [Flavobacterium sp.]|uniref:T9SS type A sorting domain-containing protein n=1 Tax=Flavobacterium sp. TaxID=239 RepID=UPI0025BD1FDA|nr:T9SS type A sorting domain-containing protein [Flavobacterium sp.]